MATKQRAILEAGARLVKAGGRLVYATCSLLQEENEAVVDAFLAAHPEFVSGHCGEILRRQDIDLDTGPYLRVFPHTHAMDAFFAAVLEHVQTG
jgi:16S rRNA (cytosine967-C5)-methyltransferase